MGTWQPDRDPLTAIRDHIVTKPGPYLDAIEHEPFTQFYELAGTKLTLPPKGYDKEHQLIEELKRKDFIAICPLQKVICTNQIFAKWWPVVLVKPSHFRSSYVKR